MQEAKSSPTSPDERFAPDRKAFTPWRRTRENTAAHSLSAAVVPASKPMSSTGRSRRRDYSGTLCGRVRDSLCCPFIDR